MDFLNASVQKKIIKRLHVTQLDFSLEYNLEKISPRLIRFMEQL